jgi:hypothetical protein
MSPWVGWPAPGGQQGIVVAVLPVRSPQYRNAADTEARGTGAMFAAGDQPFAAGRIRRHDLSVRLPTCSTKITTDTPPASRMIIPT